MAPYRLSGVFQFPNPAPELSWKEVIYTLLKCCFFSLLYVLCFDTSPHLLQVLRGLLQSCFAVKLHKCCVDYDTKTDFPSP